MSHFSRLGTLTFIAGGALFIPFAYSAGIYLHPSSNSTGLLLSSSGRGYLGVGVHDLDNDRAATLKLKDPHGAEIISIDQDAPAFKSGLKIHDVVIQMNGQRVEGIEQFRRMLHETPPGRTITLLAMRDGKAVNISVQLTDRSVLASKVIDDLDSDSPIVIAGGDATPPVLPNGHGGRSGSFFGSLTRSRYYVGVDIQPLPTGLADYFGVKNGVLVGNVFSNSPASAAGLKPADVIQKVNGQPIVTLSDWEKAIRANHGKQVQVTIIRDRKEQTLSMVAGEGKGTGDLQLPELDFPDAQTLAELRGGLEGIDAAAISDKIRESMKGIELDALRKQAEEAARHASQRINTEEIQKEAEQSRELLEQNGQQLRQQMQKLRQDLQSLQFEPMD